MTGGALERVGQGAEQRMLRPPGRGRLTLSPLLTLGRPAGCQPFAIPWHEDSVQCAPFGSFDLDRRRLFGLRGRPRREARCFPIQSFVRSAS